MIKIVFLLYDESKAEIQEKKNTNWLIVNKLINECLCVYLLLFWQFQTFHDAKPLYLKRKHQFYTNSQSWKQVVDISSQNRISYGRLFIGSKLILVQRFDHIIKSEKGISQKCWYHNVAKLCFGKEFHFLAS